MNDLVTLGFVEILQTKKDIKYKKKCPKCGTDISFRDKYTLKTSLKRNTLCRSCALSGDNNPFYGVKFSKEYKDKISIGTKKGMKNMSFENRQKMIEGARKLGLKSKGKNFQMKQKRK